MLCSSPESGSKRRRPAAWASSTVTRWTQRPRTELSAKDKELIALGVSAQIPCRYCAYSHTKAAKQNGATEREIREAVAVAAITRRMGAYMGSQQMDDSEMRSPK